jgi:hypothetical protein
MSEGEIYAYAYAPYNNMDRFTTDYSIHDRNVFALASPSCQKSQINMAQNNIPDLSIIISGAYIWLLSI